MADRPDNPGVWFPPPIWYALAVVSGFLLKKRWPLVIAGGRLTEAVGVVVLAGGVAIMVAGVGWFRRAKTTPVPIRPATTLVMSGPYRFTRNPMYVGLAIATLGCGLVLRTWWPLVLLIPTIAIVNEFVILPEERYLHRRFGVEYDAYARRVRRWL